MKRLLLLLTVSASIWAQGGPREYIATATTTALTIQKLANDPTMVNFHSAWVSCVAAQTFTLSWNGTAATATSLATVQLPNTVQSSAATAWSGSNVGGGTTGPTYTVGAGQTYPIDLSLFRLGNGGTGANLTITTTGSCTITFAFGEQL